MMKNKKGFTLIELMVAMGIIAVLVTMSVVAIQIVQQNLRNTQRRKVVEDVNLWLQSYYNDNTTYPTDLTFAATQVTVTGSSPVVVVTTLKGATSGTETGGAGTGTDGDTTKYCYTFSGGTYSVGALLEGSGKVWLGSAANCTL